LANSYHKGNFKRHPRQNAPEHEDRLVFLQTKITEFIAGCQSAAVLENGNPPLALQEGQFVLELRGGKLWLEAWSADRSYSRRLLGLSGTGNGRLDVLVQRFGGSVATITFLDLQRPQTLGRQQAGRRASFGETFRNMLYRQFPGWDVKAFSASMDLQRSFSPSFPRAELAWGGRRMAAIACPTPEDESSVLTFALLWLSYVSRRERGAAELSIFLPEGAGCLTAHRLRWLRPPAQGARLFLFNEHGSAGEVDGKDLGNLITSVSPRYRRAEFAPAVAEILDKLTCACPFIGVCPSIDGSTGLLVRGREFARLHEDTIALGLDQKSEIELESAFSQLQRLATELNSIGNAEGSRTGAGLWPSVFAGTEERWLEASVRVSVTTLDAALREEPLHRQVLTFAGRDRDALDLLGISHAGELAIIELKAQEDIHLPVQGLDYWMRIVWHCERGELNHLFPGLPVLPRAPRLLLVAPALSFHPTHASILSHFSQVIDVERIGVDLDWGHGLSVCTRLKGADVPQSHGNLYEYSGPSTHQEGVDESEP
jgi:hypothetical protein